MKKSLFILLFIISSSISAQTIFGKWENRDEETGKVDSIVEVYEKDGKAYAKIIEILDETHKNDVCVKCKGKQKDKPILGMHILNGLKKDGDEWSGGKILDPKNGKKYKCYIKLESADKLKIRGYIGFAAFGRTAYWYRKKQVFYFSLESAIIFKKKYEKNSFFLVIIFLGFLIYNLINRAIFKSSSINKKVIITYIRCSKSSKKGTKSIIKIKFNNKNYPLAINRKKCNKLNLYDSINLLYSEKGDRFFLKD